MNRIDKKLNDEGKLLSIYFTAGYPSLNDTEDIIIKLEESGVDMIEIGLPFSDPLADGPTIQDSSTEAIKNGMNSKVLFDQLKNIRSKVSIPLIIMRITVKSLSPSFISHLGKRSLDVTSIGLIFFPFTSISS